LPLITQYQVFKLSRDLNPVILKGMEGVILEILEPDKTFEVEFLDGAFNIEYEGAFTFTISIDDIAL
jgi:hypothetical protein